MSLPANVYTYAITALDGVGGESPPVVTQSIQTTGNPVTITWQGIPNAFAYNIYRAQVGTGFELLSTTGTAAAGCNELPVSRTCDNPPGSLRFSYTDDGTAVPITQFTSSSIVTQPNSGGVTTFTVPSTANIPLGQTFTVFGITDNPGLNGTYTVMTVTSPTTFTASAITPLPAGGSGTNGTVSFPVPTNDTTEQTELLVIPATAPPVSYDATMAIGVFPPPVQRIGVSAIAGNAQINSVQQQQINQQAAISSIAPFGVPLFAAVPNTVNGINVTEISLEFGLPGPLLVGDHVRINGSASHDGIYTVQTAVGPTTVPPITVINLLPATSNVESPATGAVRFEICTVSLNGVVYNAPTGSLQTISGSVATAPDNFNGTFTVRQGGNQVLGFIAQIPGAEQTNSNATGGTVTPATGTSAAGLSLARYVRLAPGERVTFSSADPLVNIARAPGGLVPYAGHVNTIGEAAANGPVPAHTFLTFAAPFALPSGVRVGDHFRITNCFQYSTIVYTVSGGNGIGPFPAGNSIGETVPVTPPSGNIASVFGLETHGFPTFGTGNPPPSIATCAFEVVRMSYAPPTLFPAHFTGILAGAVDSRYDGTTRQVLDPNPAGSVSAPVALNIFIPNAFLFSNSGGGTYGSTAGGGGGGGQPSPPPSPTVPVSGAEAATINSGIVGLLSPVPQMQQFTNRMILALGNGWPPQYVPDGTGTPVNGAFQFTVSLPSIAQQATGGALVTITLTNNPAGAPNPLGPGGQFTLVSGNFKTIGQIITVLPSPPNSFTAWLLAPPGSSIPTSGILTQTVSPLLNTFKVQFPQWMPGIAVSVGDIYTPTAAGLARMGATPCAPIDSSGTSSAIYVRCTQAGVTGPSAAAEPLWPNPCSTRPTPGLFPIKNVAENTIPALGGGATPNPPPSSAVNIGGATVTGPPIWEVVGWLNSVNPPVPGAAHCAVYSSCLFLFNTYPHQTGSVATGWGIDGPTSLRQSDVNNPFSWNPLDQVFIDKDDGQEGMGLGTFTIAAVGIPPIGSLFLFKNYNTYQLTGLFQAGIQIARVRTERGCTAPRTIRFVPGYGEARLTHLGISVSDGVGDQLISDSIRPYLFATNDRTVNDIQFMDPSWAPFSYADLTANPPMYCCAIPIGQNGDSLGALSRALCYDLTTRGWYPIDFPFSISVIRQVIPNAPSPVTLLGGWQDGLIQRWQYGDFLWETLGPAAFPVNWSYRTPLAASESPDQRVYIQELSIKGVNSHNLGTITATPTIDGLVYPTTNVIRQSRGTGADILIVVPILVTGQRFYCDVFGSGGVEIDSGNYHLVAKPLAGRLVVA
jgi:hypothetical protein